MKIDKQIIGTAGGGEVPENVSPIAFRMDHGSGVPTYLQLVQQVEHALRLGYLRNGDQLPRVKDVVGALSINPNTVLKAYRQLEQKGIAAGRPGQGTFIEASPDAVGLEKFAELRRLLTRGWLREAAAAGLTSGEITALFTTALHEVMSGEPADPRVPRGRGGAVA
jgi:GntR family transcriptional regulator